MVLCLMTSVPSLEGVVACSLSESSTSMVLADAVSPLLSLLQKPWEYPALESSAPEVDSSPASWSTSSSSSSSVVPDSSLEEE